jgi:hypothetical protein
MRPRKVLMIHGAGGGSWEWQTWSGVFSAAGARVVAPDLQPSVRGLAATRFADYEAQVRAHCEAIRPDLLVGASLGGLLALRCMDAAPTAACILVNPMPPAGFIDGDPQSGPAIVRWNAHASLRSTARAIPDASPATWQQAWTRWRDESGAVLDAARAGLAVTPTRAPSLMLVSGQDADIAPERSRALATWLQADLLELPTASHVGPLLGRDAAHIAMRALAWWTQRS